MEHLFNFELRDNVMTNELKDELRCDIEEIVESGVLSLEKIIRYCAQCDMSDDICMGIALERLIDDLIKEDPTFLGGKNILKDADCYNFGGIKNELIDIRTPWEEKMEEDVFDWELDIPCLHENNLLEKFLTECEKRGLFEDYWDIAWNIQNAISLIEDRYKIKIVDEELLDKLIP